MTKSGATIQLVSRHRVNAECSPAVTSVAACGPSVTGRGACSPDATARSARQELGAAAKCAPGAF
jgi:hypothetical protein